MRLRDGKVGAAGTTPSQKSTWKINFLSFGSARWPEELTCSGYSLGEAQRMPLCGEEHTLLQCLMSCVPCALAPFFILQDIKGPLG